MEVLMYEYGSAAFCRSPVEGDPFMATASVSGLQAHEPANRQRAQSGWRACAPIAATCSSTREGVWCAARAGIRAV